MGKHSAGGQSAERFDRRREEQKADFFDAVTEEARRLFVEEQDVDGVLVGGTSVTVEQYRESMDDAELDELIVGDGISVEYASEQSLRELAEKARERREEFELRPAEEALEEFFEALATDEEEVIYGPEETYEALAYDAVETLLLTGELEPSEHSEFEARAEEAGGDVVVVPLELEGGERFDEAFDGVGALLRFPVDSQ